MTPLSFLTLNDQAQPRAIMSSSPCQHQHLSVEHEIRLQYNYCISCNTENRGPGCAWDAYLHSSLLDTFQCTLHASRQEGVQSPSKLRCS